jgi:hypothetical protein
MKQSVLYDESGNEKLRWVKDVQPNVEEIVGACKAALVGYKPAAKPVKLPRGERLYTLTLYPFSDLHIGLLSWERETGHSWDLKIAEKELNAAADKVLLFSPSSRRAIVLGLGDQFHSNDGYNVTPKSKHPLQTDGRYPKVYEAVCRIFVRRIDACLSKHDAVDVVILIGNHDPEASVGLMYYLHAWYRNEPRVKVIVSPNYTWAQMFGNTLLVANHGDQTTPAKLPGVIAARLAKEWGRSKYRYAHVGHFHQASKTLYEAGGVMVEVHQTPVAQDAWSYGKGFVPMRSLKSITYSKTGGEISRVTVNL